MSFDFQLGIPFRPYEQLMGVLPVASMEQIPLAYQVRLVSAKLCIGLTSLAIGFDVRSKFTHSRFLSVGV